MGEDWEQNEMSSNKYLLTCDLRLDEEQRLERLEYREYQENDSADFMERSWGGTGRTIIVGLCRRYNSKYHSSR